MSASVISAILLCSATLSPTVFTPKSVEIAEEVSVPVDSERWDRSGADGEVVEHLGRECLFLRGGSFTLSGLEFKNGVIDVDVALPEARSFIGVFWRHQGPGEHEHFYLRPHQSGNPDASQYTPVFHGSSGWQLYAGEGYSAATEHSFDRWTPIKIVVWEDQAKVFVNGGEALLNIHDLKRETEPGSIGISVPANFASAHFSNFRYRPLTAAPFESIPAPEPAIGRIKRWSVSSSFPESSVTEETSLEDLDEAGLAWTPLDAEPSGIVNLARVQGISGNRNTCFARVTLTSESDQLVPLSFGFSDRVRVFLNQRLLFVGDDTYRSRDYRFLGTIGEFDRLVLPLTAGRNDLVFAVSESFGGWGFLAKLPEDADVSVE